MKSTKRPQSTLQAGGCRDQSSSSTGFFRRITNFVRVLFGPIPTPAGSCSCSSWWQRFPFLHVAPGASRAFRGVQSSAGIKLLQPDALQTHQSSSPKDHYFLSCLSLKAAFISLPPFCQAVSVSSFNKYHLRCLQPKGKQEKHFSLLLSNQCVVSSSLPGAPLL